MSEFVTGTYQQDILKRKITWLNTLPQDKQIKEMLLQCYLELASTYDPDKQSNVALDKITPITVM